MKIFGIISARYTSSLFLGLSLMPILIILLSVSCISNTDLKKIDLGDFSIIVPKEWNKSIPNDQGDSFVGEIVGPEIKLSFDCSRMGYANHLISTTEEYLNGKEWMHDIYFYQVGIPFNKGLPAAGAKENIHIPSADQIIKFPKADYIADLTYKDSTIYVPIQIPKETKLSNFQVDSDSKYVYKTIWPKTIGKGLTGIYIHSRNSDFNFQMGSMNLSQHNQELTLQAFKTIRLKD